MPAFSTIVIDYDRCYRKTFEDYPAMAKWTCDGYGETTEGCTIFCDDNDVPRTSFVSWAEAIRVGGYRSNPNATRIFAPLCARGVVPTTGRLVLWETIYIDGDDDDTLTDILKEHDLKWFKAKAEELYQ